jgi:hypothetical protein
MVAKVQPKERGTQIEERVDDSGNYKGEPIVTAPEHAFTIATGYR